MLKRFLILCVFCWISMVACARSDVDKQPEETGYEQSKQDDVPEDSNGPTISLTYDKNGAYKNATTDFMYFVPLISPVSVDREVSPGNRQLSGLVSSTRKYGSKSFCVSCEFQVQGEGFHKNTFDSSEMIERNIKDLKKGGTLKNMLDYIKFEGDCNGRIDVTGEIVGSAEIVTKAVVHFNNRGQKSPVTIGIYSVKPVDGEYKYENRYNEIVARINTITFERTEGTPKMEAKLASLRDVGESEGIWGNVKGSLANWFIEPLEINKVGNDAMLDLGYALFKRKPSFTFPKAKNLKEVPQAAKTLQKAR